MRCARRAFIAGRLARRAAPRREQVVFFQLPEAAEQKGFRACLRCKPSAAPAADPNIEKMRSVCRAIDEAVLADTSGEAGMNLSLAALAAQLAMGPHQLERAFRRAIGITPRQYADAQRMRRVKSRLKKGDDVTTALYEAGYGSSSRLYERAPSHLGMTPATYRRGGEGMQIHYTFADSPLGRMLVGATDRGVSALYIGDSDSKLEAALRKEYPRAAISRDRNGLSKWLQKILAHLRGREPHLDLPTDVQATALSSGAFGRSCGGFPTARREHTAKWRVPWAVLRRFAPWLAPARRIRYRWWSRAPAW